MTHDHARSFRQTRDTPSTSSTLPLHARHTTHARRAHAARAYFNYSAAPPVQRQEKAHANACEALSDEEKARRHALQTEAQKHGARVHNTPNPTTGRCDATLTDAHGSTAPIHNTDINITKTLREAGRRHADHTEQPKMSIDDDEGMTLKEAQAKREQIKEDAARASTLGGAAPWIFEGLRNDITGKRKPYDDTARDAKMCEAGNNLFLNLLGGAAVKGNGKVNPNQRWVNPDKATKTAHKKKRTEEDE